MHDLRHSDSRPDIFIKADEILLRSNGFFDRLDDLANINSKIVIRSALKERASTPEEFAAVFERQGIDVRLAKSAGEVAAECFRGQAIAKSSTPAKKQLLLAFRWIAVLPAALAAFGLAQAAVIVASLFLPIPNFLAQLWSAWVCPAAAVVAGAYVAPRSKFVVALIITTGLTALSSILIFLVLSGAYAPSGVNKWWFLITTVVGLGAPVSACISLHRDEIIVGTLK